MLISDGRGNCADAPAQRLPPQSDNNFGGFYIWIRLVDLNGDGHLDIATGLETGGEHTSPYFLNDGTGVFARLPDNLGQPPNDTYTLAELGGGRGLDMVSGEGSIYVARTTKPKDRLYVTLGPGNYFSFTGENGRSVRSLRPGLYTLVVWDRSPTRVFRIRGPSADLSSQDGVGVVYWDVLFGRGQKYAFTVTAPARHGWVRVTKR
jgi:hypothetical protein